MWRKGTEKRRKVDFGSRLAGDANDLLQQLPFPCEHEILAHSQNAQMDGAASQDADLNKICDFAESSAALCAKKSDSENEYERSCSECDRTPVFRSVEGDNVSPLPLSYPKLSDGKSTRESKPAFNARVDRLLAASEKAHQDYLERLHDVYSASTAKKMRLSTSVSPSDSAAGIGALALPQSRHEALDTLAVAAASENCKMSEALMKPSTIILNNIKRENRRRNSQSYKSGKAVTRIASTGTKQSPILVHDPGLAHGIDKLTNKLAHYLGHILAKSDAAAMEPIVAAAEAIAFEATEMHRCENVALTRMMEIEGQRQQIMQEFQEYAKRKEQGNRINRK
ncbi:hypothetical protein CCR75_007575 [Bremia lactucae]|uniref:Uncharacterized protein n=1 Tax=Bremia lactucae TaxID=4779 RepID=A0A976FDF9_BRELC|nr:hypothetical protein CCR75_007575 [Bremia lactucae]